VEQFVLLQTVVASILCPVKLSLFYSNRLDSDRVEFYSIVRRIYCHASWSHSTDFWWRRWQDAVFKSKCSFMHINALILTICLWLHQPSAVTLSWTDFVVLSKLPVLYFMNLKYLCTFIVEWWLECCFCNSNISRIWQMCIMSLYYSI